MNNRAGDESDRQPMTQELDIIAEPDEPTVSLTKATNAADGEVDVEPEDADSTGADDVSLSDATDPSVDTGIGDDDSEQSQDVTDDVLESSGGDDVLDGEVAESIDDDADEGDDGQTSEDDAGDADVADAADEAVSGSGPASPPPAAPAPSTGMPVVPRLIRLESELRRWAEEHGVTDDPYLEAIRGAIAQGDNLSSFVAADPLEFLPVPSTKRGRVWAAAGRYVAVLRNVLVFVPVLLTWWAISEATKGYGRYIDAVDRARQASIDSGEGVAERTVNFLEFWESGGAGQDLPGFTPLPGHWRITHIATLDAAIIAAVIALTFLVGILEARGTSRRGKAELQLERDRIRIAIAIRQGLEGNRSIDTETLEVTLARALTDLGQAARDVNVAAQRMESASVGMDALGPRITGLTREVELLSQQFSTEVQQSIQNLSGAVGALGSTLEGDLQQFMADVLAGLEEVVERLRTTSTGVEFGTKQLRDDLDAIHQRLAAVVR